MSTTSSLPEALAQRGARTASALAELKRQWLLVALAGYAALGAAQLADIDVRWTLGVCVAWSVIVSGFYSLLGANRRGRDAPLLDGLTAPTLVTLVRGLLVAAVAGFLLLPPPAGVLAWVTALAYSLAAALDHVDGRLARRWGTSTELGARLDMELDAFGILVAVALGISWGKLPEWYLAIGLARYAFVFGEGWRRRRGKSVRELDPNRLRRHLAGFQMGFLAAALWPLVPAEASRLAACLFGAFTLGMFVRDWLVVTNRAVASSWSILPKFPAALRRALTVVAGLLVVVLTLSVGEVGLTLGLGAALIASLIAFIFVPIEQH